MTTENTAKPEEAPKKAAPAKKAAVKKAAAKPAPKPATKAGVDLQPNFASRRVWPD